MPVVSRSRPSLWWLLSLWAVLAMAWPVPARAQEEAGDLLLNAYMLREEGTRAEKQRDFSGAYRLYRESAALYDRLAREFPDWKPGIVEMRRKGMADQINAVADKATRMDAGKPVPRETTSPPPSGVAVAPTPGGTAVGIRPPVGLAAAVDDPLARKRIEALEQRQGAMQNLLADLTKQRDNLQARLDEAAKARALGEHELKVARAEKARIQAELASLQEKGINTSVAGQAEVRQLKASLEDAGRKLAAAEEKVARQGQESAAALRENQELKVALADAKGQLAAAGDGTAPRPQLAAVEAELRGKLAAVEADLSQTRNQLDGLRAERDNLAGELDRVRKERDGFEALLAQKVPGLALLETNYRLEAELARARDELAKLGSARDRDSAQIDQLRGRLGQVEAELAAVRRENAGVHDQMARLQERLAQTQKSLADAEGALRDSALVEENRTLREIVIRQLRAQAYRTKARTLLLAELAKLEINSKALLQYIDQIEGKDAVPTPGQVARIHDPEIEALSGVGLNAVMFLNEQPEERAGEGTAANASPGGATPAVAAGGNAVVPPELAGDPDARAAFIFQKKSLAEEATRSFGQGDFPKAEETYRLIVEADPADVPMRCNLGVALLRQHKFEAARDTFQRALETDESSAFAHLMLGVCHWQMKQPELAVDRFNRSLVLQPRNAQAWTYLGLVAMERSAFGDAETAFRKVIEIRPDDPEAHYNLAVVCTKPGRADPVEARKQYDEAVRLGARRDAVLEDFLRLGTPAPEALPAADPLGPPLPDEALPVAGLPGGGDPPDELPELGPLPK